jgi:hypothetical protein
VPLLLIVMTSSAVPYTGKTPAPLSSVHKTSRLISFCLILGVASIAISLWCISHYVAIRDANTPALLTIPPDTAPVCLEQRGVYYGSGTITSELTDGLSTSFSGSVPVSFGSTITTVSLSGFILGNAFSQVVSTKFIASSPIARLEASSAGIQQPVFTVNLQHPSLSFSREFSLSSAIIIHPTTSGFELRTKASTSLPQTPLDLRLRFGEVCSQATSKPLELTWIKKVSAS